MMQVYYYNYISVPLGDGGNPSPLGEEKFIVYRYATLSTWSTYKKRPEGLLNLDSEMIQQYIQEQEGEPVTDDSRFEIDPS